MDRRAHPRWTAAGQLRQNGAHPLLVHAPRHVHVVPTLVMVRFSLPRPTGPWYLAGVPGVEAHGRVRLRTMCPLPFFAVVHWPEARDATDTREAGAKPRPDRLGPRKERRRTAVTFRGSLVAPALVLFRGGRRISGVGRKPRDGNTPFLRPIDRRIVASKGPLAMRQPERSHSPGWSSAPCRGTETARTSAMGCHPPHLRVSSLPPVRLPLTKTSPDRRTP